MIAQAALGALAVAAGACAAIQGAANAGLAKAIGLGPALVVNTVLVLVGTLGLWAVLGGRATLFPAGASWAVYVGGLCGFVIIASLAFVFPKIGAAYTVALMVGGQCLAALVIDHYGVMGMSRDPLTLQRVIGVALAAAGVVVMRM